MDTPEWMKATGPPVTDGQGGHFRPPNVPANPSDSVRKASKTDPVTAIAPDHNDREDTSEKELAALHGDASKDVIATDGGCPTSREVLGRIAYLTKMSPEEAGRHAVKDHGKASTIVNQGA